MAYLKDSGDVHKTTIRIFNPPGYLQDLNGHNRKLWSANYIGTWIQDEIQGKEAGPAPGSLRTPLSQFFDPTETAYDTTQNKISATWRGFPNRISLQYQNREPLRWRMADASRFNQDEYLEWTVDRDPSSNQITSVQFTNEGPEYWQLMAETQPDTMISLYKSLNPNYASQMVDDDFFLTNNTTRNSVYNPQNLWNQSSDSGTIAHLIHPSNQLSAEIDIVAQATVLRKGKDGNLLTDSLDLINCSQYGNRGRNSDPVIGGIINKLARMGVNVTIADPIGLYIKSIDTSSLLLAKSPTNMIPLPAGVVTWPRSKPPLAVRLLITIPPGCLSDTGVQLTVSDIYDTGTKRYIEFGAQFADYITISVSGVGVGGTTATPLACLCASQAPGGPDPSNPGRIVPVRGHR